MSVDPETVTMMASYRVGFLPPRPDSLSAGELYIELGTTAGAAPQVWVGAIKDDSFGGNVASLIPGGIELPPPLPQTAPVNVDVPALLPIGPVVTGDALNCTMGNWQGEPTAYHYAWLRDDVDPIGEDSPDYITVVEDEGHFVTCTVTAENVRGSTAAPPSNTVTVNAP
jgi:hypothetical protein